MAAATRELWHRAGRAAGEGRKRLVALQGVLWSAPVLVLGAALARLPALPSLAEVARPLAFVLGPAEAAWREGSDLALAGYVLLQALLLALLWSLFAGALYRMAAVDLGGEPRESGRQALRFARRHWPAFAGARLALWLGTLAPIALAGVLVALGRIPGLVGGLLVLVGAAAALLLVAASVVVGSVTLLGGFLTGPTVACEDSDAFDAVSRAFTYVGAGPPRLLGRRLLFLGGVALGSLWRLLRSVAVALLVLLCLSAGAPPRLERALAVLGAGGPPPDAARLGVELPDVLLAGLLAVMAGVLASLWLADLVSRVCCARVAVYLLEREHVDGLPPRSLATATRGRRHLGPEEAGFVEVARVGGE